MREAKQVLKDNQFHMPSRFCVSGTMDLPEHDDLFAPSGSGTWLGDIGRFIAPLSRLNA